jgi:uncharacterized protein (DUF169 family)
MPAFSELHRSLTESLHLAQAPVAVCLSDSLPTGVGLWTGTAPAGCRFWQEASTKVFATTARHHDLCAIGIHTHNLETTPATSADLDDALKVFGELGYVRAEDIPQIPVLGERPRYVIYGPLAEIPAAPDVVLLFVQANQTLILSEAAQQIEGGLPPAMGRPACAIIPQAKNTGRAALSLGCCGARAYLDALTDDVALFAIPGDKLQEFADRIEALAMANQILTKFHTIRRTAVESGATPTVRQSLDAMQG